MLCFAALPRLVDSLRTMCLKSSLSPTLSLLGSKSATMETLIFVDVDGVLNVNIGDPGNSPMEFNIKNVERALAQWDNRQNLSPRIRACLERIVAVHSRKVCNAEGATFADLVSESNSLSDVAVGRLAKVIQAAGESCSVVLSSTWRLPRYDCRLRQLEDALSRHLGRPFGFHDRTGLIEDRTADERLRCIGDYVEKYRARVGSTHSNLRVMLLEDFHVRPLGSWACDGRKMNSLADVEEYLCTRAPGISAKLIHTFDEWLVEGGLRVQVGTGLTQALVHDALVFLGVVQKEGGHADVATSAAQKLVTCDV